MGDQLQSENRNMLAAIAAGISFPYVWLGLFVFLYWLYRIGFFGYDLGSIILPALICLGLLSPAVPAALTRFVIKPLFSNLLGREVISAPGCISGLVTAVIAGFVSLYLLSRGSFQTAGLFLLLGPLVGAILAGGISLIFRGGGIRLGSRRRSSPSTGRPPSSRPQLPGGGRTPPSLPSQDRPALPSRPPSPPTRRPTSRRSKSRPSAPPSRPKPPSRRR